jgi:hypothetical protein
LLVLRSAPALALSPAEASFHEGRRLLAAGQIDAACARFAESYTLVASSGTLLNLALCHETQGKIATAWTEYRAAARLAHNQGRDDRAAVADEKAASLEAKLPRLTLIASAAVPGLEIATEEGPLGEGGAGVAVPIDPGTHQVIARAPGYLPWTASVELKEAEQKTLEVPALEAKPAPPAASTTPRVAAPTAAIALPNAAPARSNLERYLVYGGAVGLVAGTVLWSVAYAKFESAKDACNSVEGCSDRDSRVSTIETLKTLSIGCWVVGGALVAASGLHYAFRKTRTPLTVSIDPMLGGLAVAGMF